MLVLISKDKIIKENIVLEKNICSHFDDNIESDRTIISNDSSDGFECDISVESFDKIYKINTENDDSEPSYAEEYNNEKILVDAAKSGDSLATTLLIVKYRGFLYKYVGLLNVPSGYKEDFIQEGLIGLLKAVRTYDSMRDCSFSTYAKTCVRNSVISALRYHKKKWLDNEISIEDISDGLFEVVHNPVANSPEDEYLYMESSSQLHDTIFSVLSTYEAQVFGMYLAEMPYSLIASRLGKDIKSIDNAIQRIKNKLKKLV